MRQGEEELFLGSPPPTRRTPEIAAPGRSAAKNRSSISVISADSAAR
ncbi:MAG: hypothetical protein ACKOQ3_08590 [Novosphingobium sp.]